MSFKIWIPILVLAVVAALAVILPCVGGEVPLTSGYKVLSPIRHGNLTVFPVTAAFSHSTQAFLTLDEGLRSGEVIVTEAGNVQPLMRRRTTPINHDGAQVNRLVLVNNSKRPLILLAGEIVTGGKQDRVIGKDRLVPAESDPIDLGVFCVEPGRWTATSAKFGPLAPMASPAVRGRAMSDKDQAKVWSEVRNAQTVVASRLPAPAASEVAHTSSYAGVMQNEEVKQQVDSIAEPIQRNYQSLIQQLRERNAVGVVVAVNGEIIWADIFASTALLEKYWPKLVRSYAAEAFVVTRAKGRETDVKSAQEFLDTLEGRRETVESEPGLYRHTEITGDGFKAFELTALLPKTGFDLHLAKMAE